MEVRPYIKTLLIILLLGGAGSLFASITIDSTQTTPNNCANNGRIIIYAHSSSSLLYSIIGGPDIRPPQSGNQFAALPNGLYQILVTNFSNDSALVNTTVYGDYQFPDFTPTYLHPYCDNSSTGQIVGNANLNFGRPPFTWELLNVNTNITITQASDSFLNLPEGDYRLRQFDSCQSFATRYVTLQDPTPNLVMTNFNNRMIACDTVEVWMSMFSHGGVYAPPYTIQVQTNNGVYQHALTSIQYGGWYPEAIERVGGVTYGDIITFTITDACGNSTTKIDGISDFNVGYSFSGYYDSCQAHYSANFGITPTIWNQNTFPTSFHLPVVITISNPNTGAIVDSIFVTDTTSYSFSIVSPSLIPGQTYNVSIRDECGHTYFNTIQSPALPPPVFSESIENTHCIDSTATYSLQWYNYFSSIPTIHLLSGPATIRSTKPRYSYHDTIIYPQSNPAWPTTTSTSDVGYGIEFTNLGIGTYHYRVTDSCGNSIVDSFTIHPQDVSDYHYQISYTKGCPGQNKINLTYYDINVNAYIGNNTIGLQLVQTQNSATVVNLNHGEYYLSLNYYKMNPVAVAVNQTQTCQIVLDTIIIPPYELPKIDYATQTKCNGTVNVGFQPDSSKGIPPYGYEILSGPQTAPEQVSQFFTLTQPGNYVARITDTCGFARTFSFFVDTLSLLQMVKTGSSCLGDSAILVGEHSPYATYIWQKPDGSFYTGDSLRINPVTSADYGLYEVTKIVNVNNCRDTFYATYELNGSSVTYSSDTICNGENFSFGGNNYSISGTYYDTIPTSFCDSISVLNLTVRNGGYDSVSLSICEGQSITVGSNVYSASGIYRDTFATAACDSVHILNLQVLPIIRDTTSQSICNGESFSFGGNNYSVAGTYRDTIATSLCSISVLNLTVLNGGFDSVSLSICEGQSITVGSNVYSATGIYHDTLSTAACDSVHILNLQVIPLKRDTISQSICNGEIFSFGGNNYSIAGTYYDTIPTSLCDSISVLNLTVRNGGHDSVSLSICEGQSIAVGSNIYSASGIYRDTFVTAGCDSVHILNLQILPLKLDTVSFSFCEGDSITIGSQTYTSSVSYTDTFATTSCDSLRTINVTMFPRPIIQVTADSEEVLSGDAVQLNVTGNYLTDYFWTSTAVLNEVNIQNPTGFFYQSSWASVMATDSNTCSVIDSVFVAVRNCEGTIWVPNAFTPNGDGTNDLVRVFGDCVRLQRFLIFNRWGEKMWDTTDIEQGWDGYYKGILQPVGVYVYYASYSSANPHRTAAKELKGSITLIR